MFFEKHSSMMAVKNITTEISLILIPKDTFRDTPLNVTKCQGLEQGSLNHFFVLFL